MTDPRYDLSRFLPTTVKEIQMRGWDYIDVIIFSGDAYVDHPSFGAAVIGRTLEAAGYRVAIVPQPNWRDDLRDFRKLGRPRLFFGISAGAMDSMVNHYTAARRLRHDDAYTPEGRHGARPDYPTIVYSTILKKLYPDVPVIAGGIEASMRRLSHYDYWENRLRPSILCDSHADMLIYGMGEQAITQLARRLAAGEKISGITDIPQTVFFMPTSMTAPEDALTLHSHEKCLKDKRSQAENFRNIEIQSNKMAGVPLLQEVGGRIIIVNPMYPPLTTKQIDASFDLPYTRLPHPRYKGKEIPAYAMIRHSICLHRGCFGGCAFCTISAHQGKFIASRSKASILREARQVAAMHDFKGYISDLGGPSANMYAMGGFDLSKCAACTRPSCLHPHPCPNLNNDHRPLLDIYHAVDSIAGVKKSFIGSGVRYDLSMTPHPDPKVTGANERYNRELITAHVSGRLKVAPEHTSPDVLKIMRKPEFSLFHKFKRLFDKVNAQEGLRQQLIPYFISSHPGCTAEAMAELAAETKQLDFHLEQVQDFTPTPMTLSTEIYYTGIHPYTLESVYTATTPAQKQEQRAFFFWYEHDHRPGIIASLRRMHRPDLIDRLYGHTHSSQHQGHGRRTTSPRHSAKKK